MNKFLQCRHDPSNPESLILNKRLKFKPAVGGLATYLKFVKFSPRTSDFSELRTIHVKTELVLNIFLIHFGKQKKMIKKDDLNIHQNLITT